VKRFERCELPWNKAITLQLAKPLSWGLWNGWFRLDTGSEVMVKVKEIDGDVLCLLRPGSEIFIQVLSGILCDWCLGPLPKQPCLSGDEWKDA